MHMPFSNATVTLTMMTPLSLSSSRLLSEHCFVLDTDVISTNINNYNYVLCFTLIYWIQLWYYENRYLSNKLNTECFQTLAWGVLLAFSGDSANLTIIMILSEGSDVGRGVVCEILFLYGVDNWNIIGIEGIEDLMRQEYCCCWRCSMISDTTVNIQPIGGFSDNVHKMHP